jgi:cytochrome c oxidase assembly protein subunit 15
MAAIIMAMITIGGLTRITGSGLSITEWDLLMGALPPLNDAQWADVFAKYRLIPQYRAEHLGMSLEAFRGIFWWEWSHRLLGRLLGVVYIVPFAWFAWKGAIKREHWPRMLVLFLLGALQGFIGWWMVESGLEVRTSVSQYRLAIHLGTALLLLVAILWIALEYLRGGQSTGLSKRATGFGVLVYLQMLLGALVAGLHAGLVYNTWPDMDGRLFPEGAFFNAPWWINFFENDGLAQFDHRIGAYIVAACAVWVWIKARGMFGWVRTSANLILGITVFQVALGITTLLLQAPEGLAALHQVTAATLLCAAVWHAYEMRIYAKA